MTATSSESPKRLGDFEILRQIGRGGMGVVYEARQVSLNRKVALKVLSARLGLTHNAVERFRREAEAAARLHHTNIIPIYATGAEDDVHFYAMELIEGPSLDSVLGELRRGQAEPARAVPGQVPTDSAPTGPYLPGAELLAPALSSSSPGSDNRYFDTVAGMIADVADALEYAHKNGVIHRDIKPSNLLLAPDGRLSVNDFGLARVLDQPGMTLSGDFVGTPRYMSPEQIAAGRTPVDHRTDVYSLGATLYELLTLRPAFAAKERDQVFSQILHKEPRPPRRWNRNVPLDLETICLKALEKDPDRRYPTAGQMALDLRRYLDRFAITARRAGPMVRLRKWVKRQPALAAALVCVLVASAVAGAIGWRAHLSDLRHSQEQRQLQEERRQAIVERALLAAMSGAFDEAESAIASAEREGASTGQLEFLHGEVAYYRGQDEKAIVHLERATQLLPHDQTAAARGLLAVCYYDSGQTRDFERELAVLGSIAPVTLEDLIFKGYALSWFEADQGLKFLNLAVARSPSSPIARLFRADASCQCSQDHGDAAAADDAIADALTARKLLSEGNPLGLSECALVMRRSAGVYKAAGLLEKYRSSAREASACAERLAKSYPEPSWGYFQHLDCLWCFGDPEQAVAEARKMVTQTERVDVPYVRSLILYAHGTGNDRQELLPSLKPGHNQFTLDSMRCCLLADVQGPDAALKSLQQLLRQDLAGHFRLYYVPLLFLLKREDLVREVSRQDRRRPLHFLPSEEANARKVLDYLAGDLSDDELLAGDNGPRWHQSRAHYIIGLAHLAKGDRTAALEHLGRAVDMCVYDNVSYELSKAFLTRLKGDPQWPSWIPAMRR